MSSIPFVDERLPAHEQGETGWSFVDWLWFLWWLLLGILAVLGICCLFGQRQVAAGLLLSVSGFFAVQTVGWYFTSRMIRTLKQELERTRLGDAEAARRTVFAGSRFWGWWHFLGLWLSCGLLVVGLNPQNQPGGAISLLLWFSTQLVAMVLFIFWFGRRRSMAATMRAAQLLDFTYWPQVPSQRELPLDRLPSLKLTNGLTGRIADWHVLVADGTSDVPTSPLAHRLSTVLIVGPTLQTHFELAPRRNSEDINWLGMLFHMLHVIGWFIILIELGSKLLQRPRTKDQQSEINHGDRPFAKRYTLHGMHAEKVLLVLHHEIRQGLLPRHWLVAPWYLRQHEPHQLLLARPGLRVAASALPEFIAENLRLVERLEAAEAELAESGSAEAGEDSREVSAASA